MFGKSKSGEREGEGRTKAHRTNDQIEVILLTSLCVLLCFLDSPPFCCSVSLLHGTMLSGLSLGEKELVKKEGKELVEYM